MVFSVHHQLRTWPTPDSLHTSAYVFLHHPPLSLICLSSGEASVRQTQREESHSLETSSHLILLFLRLRPQAPGTKSLSQFRSLTDGPSLSSLSFTLSETMAQTTPLQTYKWFCLSFSQLVLALSLFSLCLTSPTFSVLLFCLGLI